MNAWKKGASNYSHAVTLFKKAEEILSNEIEAGHYTLSHLGILNHTTANGDQTWSVSEYKTAFNSMWNGFKEDLAYNFNGKTETVDCIGLLPIWNVCAMGGWSSMKAEPQAFYNDFKDCLNGKLVNYAMSALDDDDVIMASTIGRDWCAGDSAVAEYFSKNPIEDLYTKHSGGRPVSPTTLQNGVYGDGVHYNQLGYNVTGMEASESLYSYWYLNQKASSYQLLQEDGKTEVPATLELNAGEDYVIVPEVTPSYAKVDYSISDDDVISYQDCILYAKASGEATLTIGGTTVTVTVTGTAPDPTGEKRYEWTFEDGTQDTVTDDSSGSNVIETVTGEATVTDGVLDATNAVLKLATPVTIDPEKNWSVEVTMSAKTDAGGAPASTGTLLNSTANLYQSTMSIWVPKNGNMCLVQRQPNGFKWYMVSDSDWAANFPSDYDATEPHTYRLMNTNGTVSYWLDGKKIGDLTVYS